MQSSERVGQTFHWVRRVYQTEMFEVWDGQSSTGQPAIMVLVTPGAVDNQAARAAFVDAVRWAQRPDTDVVLLGDDSVGVKPWAAVAADRNGQAFAERLLGLPPSLPPNGPPPVPPPVPAPFPPQAAPVLPPGSPVAPPGSPVVPPWSPAPTSGPPVAPYPMPPAGPPPAAPWGQAPDPANPTPLPWGTPQPGPAPQQPWDGQPHPVRSPDIPPLPGPHDFAERRRRRSRTRLRVALIAGVVLVLAAAAATAAFVLPGRAKDSGTKPPTASASPSPSPTPPPRPTFQESAVPVAVVGSTWQPGEATKVQDFGGWPFAFRTPAEATCEFFVDEPGYKAHNCRWGTEPNHTVMAFVVRRCANSCDATEQAQFETMTPWTPDGVLAPTDATTKVVDVDYGDGRGQFTMLHYFGTTPGGPLQWVVIVQGNTPKQSRDRALKTMNDVRSQTP